MKKQIGGVLLCIMIITTIPVAAGMNPDTEPDTGTTDIGSTFIRGIITKPRLTGGGHYITFRAIYVHYRIHSFGGREEGWQNARSGRYHCA